MAARKRNIFKIIMLVGLLALPTVLFYFFIYTGVHKVNRLPFYGPVRIVDTTYHGKHVKDTVYHEIPVVDLLTTDSTYFNPLQLEQKIYIAHFLDFSKMDSLPKQIVFCVSQVLEKHPDIFAVTYLEHYHGQPLPLPSSFTTLLAGKDTTWKYVIVPDDQLTAIKTNGYFKYDPDVKEQPDPYSMVLVDKERRIRGYYNPTYASDIKRIKDEVEYLKKEYLLNYRTHKFYEYDDKLEQKQQKNKKK